MVCGECVAYYYEIYGNATAHTKNGRFDYEFNEFNQFNENVQASLWQSCGKHWEILCV